MLSMNERQSIEAVWSLFLGLQHKLSSAEIEDLLVELDHFIKLLFFHRAKHDAGITFDQVWRIGFDILPYRNSLYAAQCFLTFA